MTVLAALRYLPLLTLAALLCASIADADSDVIIDTPSELTEADSNPSVPADELAREFSNPNTPLAKLGFKNITTNFKRSLPGAGEQSVDVSLFQPIVPFPLDESGTLNLFVRPAIPFVVDQPCFNTTAGSFGSATGLGDIGFNVALVRSYDSGLILVGGAFRGACQLAQTYPTVILTNCGVRRCGQRRLILKKVFSTIIPSITAGYGKLT